MKLPLQWAVMNNNNKSAYNNVIVVVVHNNQQSTLFLGANSNHYKSNNHGLCQDIIYTFELHKASNGALIH